MQPIAPLFQSFFKRTRINELLMPENNNLIIVEAGAGYGKTLSVYSLLTSEEVMGEAVWLHLTLNHNRILHFWQDFKNAFKDIDQKAAHKIEAMSFPSDLYAMNEFAHVLELLQPREKPFIIVLDDYHILINEAVKGFIRSMTLLAKENFYIYVLTRTIDEPFPNDDPIRYKHIIASDLAFTMEELLAYFLQYGIELPYDMLYNIYTKTGGWPVAVYLLFVTLKNIRCDGRLEMAQMSKKLLFDTIQHEIFSQYTAEEQQFILQLSLLKNYPLHLLEDLFAEELPKRQPLLASCFFISFNQQEQIFEFHEIFNEFLQDRMYLLSQENRDYILRKAAQWYQKRGLTVDALTYYKKINDYEAMWRIILDLQPAYFHPEFIHMQINLLNDFPEAYKKANPLIKIITAALYLGLYQLSITNYLIGEVITELESGPINFQIRQLLGIAYCVLSFSYMIQGDKSFAAMFRKAAGYLPEGNSFYANSPYYFVLNDSTLPITNKAEDEMMQWVRTLKEAEPYYSKLFYGKMDGLADVSMADSCFYQGDMDTAEKYAFRGLYQGKEHKQVDIVCHSYFVLMKIHFYQGHYEKTLEMLNTMEAYSQKYNTSPQFHLPVLAHSWLYAQLDIKSKISDWIMREQQLNMQVYAHDMGFERLIKAYTLLKDGEYAQIIPYLEQIKKIYKVSNRYIYLIHAYILSALAYYERKEYSEAALEFYTAYTMAWRNRIVTLFAFYGQRMSKLTSRLLNISNNAVCPLSGDAKQKINEMQEWMELIQPKASAFYKRLLAMKELYYARHPEGKETHNELTQREINMILAISQGLTREEIAAEMNITINTLKSALTTIYSKLGATNSAHAVRIATLRHII